MKGSAPTLPFNCSHWLWAEAHPTPVVSAPHFVTVGPGRERSKLAKSGDVRPDPFQVADTPSEVIEMSSLPVRQTGLSLQ